MVKIIKDLGKNLTEMDKYIIDLDEFKIIKSLGKGGFGEVFLIENIATTKQYAAKVSIKKCIKKQDQIFFFTEVSTLIEVNNPAVLKILGFSLYNFSQDPYPTIVLEYIPKGTLEEMIEKKLPLSCPKRMDQY